MITLNNLIKSYYSCRIHKRTSINALKYELSWEKNLVNLYKQLKEGTYTPSRSICFAVSYPKVREIFAADFRDRIVHHLLINQIEDFYEKRFIFDSCACRPRKGTHFALLRLKRILNQGTNNKRKNFYYMQIDVKTFFYSINKNILMNLLINKLSESYFCDEELEEILWLAEKIIFNNPCVNYKLKGDLNLFNKLPRQKSLFNIPPDKGLPIGNLTSQFFANVYLNEVDQFIKRDLQFKNYIRYADDMILLDEDPRRLQDSLPTINNFLKYNLDLQLHPDKTKINSVYSGIDFLGYIVRPQYTLTRKRVVQNLKKKLYYFNKGILILENNCREEAIAIHNPPSYEEVQSICRSINALLGHIVWSNSFNLRQDIYHKHLGILNDYLEPQNNCSSYKVIMKS